MTSMVMMVAIAALPVILPIMLAKVRKTTLTKGRLWLL